MRNAFVETIEKIAEQDDRVVLLVGDLGYKIFDSFKEKFPNRFYNVGIAEANMVSMAAGMAKAGFKPYVYSIAPFVTLRCCEHIRNDVAYNRTNVTIVGVGGGLCYGHNGPTHHAIEDIAIMRSIPNMVVACPSTPQEVNRVMWCLHDNPCPCYLRLGRGGEPEISEGEMSMIEFGKGIHLYEGKDLTLFSTGNMLPTAIKVREEIEKRGLMCGVATFPFVKPLDVECIEEIAVWSQNIVTIEEHNINGGFGGAVAEYLMESNIPVGFMRFGIQDTFAQVSGDQEYLRFLSCLDAKTILENILDTFWE